MNRPIKIVGIVNISVIPDPIKIKIFIKMMARCLPKLMNLPAVILPIKSPTILEFEINVLYSFASLSFQSNLAIRTGAV